MTPLKGQQTLLFVDKPAPANTDGPPCLKCGADTIVSPGVGPHYARIDCPSCKAWRWAPAPRPDRGGAA
jgi:hypothetical protein